jgi:predicted SnoaL-like aldol condensation-catalyzing enzyme
MTVDARGGSEPQTQDERRSAHKDLVRRFCQAFYNSKDFDTARTMLTEDFVNHRPGLESGRDNTITAFRRQVADPLPEFSLEIRRIVAEDDFVWTHGLIRTAPDTPAAISVDIWRIADGQLTEHWDVGQPIPDGVAADDLLA